MTDDRTREGTVKNRRAHPGARFYAVSILVALIAAYAATQALSVSGTAKQAARDARQAAAQARMTAAQAKATAAQSSAIAKQSALVAREAAAASTAIQQNRVKQCKDGNGRHNATLHAIAVLERRELRHATRAQRRQIVASRAGTDLVINALVPKRDCTTLGTK